MKLMERDAFKSCSGLLLAIISGAVLFGLAFTYWHAHPWGDEAPLFTATANAIMLVGGLGIVQWNHVSRWFRSAVYIWGAMHPLLPAVESGTITTLNPLQMTLSELAAFITLLIVGAGLVASFHIGARMFWQYGTRLEDLRASSTPPPQERK